MGVRRGGQNGHFPPLEIGTKKEKFLEKREISSLILISWVNSCNGSLFADMTLTLHKSQLHCFGNMQLWACSSLHPLLCLQRQVAKLASELFYYWSLLLNNTMVTNVRTCTSSHGSMRFTACNYWMQGSCSGVATYFGRQTQESKYPEFKIPLYNSFLTTYCCDFFTL